MRRLALLVLIVESALLAPAGFAAKKICTKLLTEKASPKSGGGTELVAYLGDLFNAHTIGSVEHNRFIEGLRRGELVNPIDEESAQTNSRLLIHRDGLGKLIEKMKGAKRPELTKLRTWAQGVLRKGAAIEVERSEAQKETKSTLQKLEFHPVPPRKFQMGKVGKNLVEVELTHPIAVMSTLFTQKQWVDLFGVNPAEKKKGKNTVVEIVKGKKILMQPDHPVESISWWSAIVAANKLSEKHGLKPVYDTSGIKWFKGSSAAKGTLGAERGELKINAPEGDIYQAEGYRLPTEAEQESLIRLEQDQNGAHDYKERAWYLDNSDDTTHPVGELMPLRVEGKEIFDIIGNVYEMSHDWYDDLASGKNPSGPKTGIERANRGGSWADDARSLTPDNRSSFSPDASNYDIGFRLVRTLR